MQALTQTAEKYLGGVFELYKKAHPEVKPYSKVVEIPMDRVMFGFQQRIYEPQPINPLEMSQIATPKYKDIIVKPEQFETWAASKNSRWFRVAFVEELNTLYVAVS